MTTKIKPGQMIHFLTAQTVPIPSGQHVVVSRGGEMEVTGPIIEASLDRLGRTWLDLFDDEKEQVRQWGEVRFRAGSWPETEDKLVPGSWEWEREREAARSTAHRILNERDRAAALANVEHRFGRATQTNQTLNEWRTAK